jgi:hypothetical protein
MDEAEARVILQAEIDKLRGLPYERLQNRLLDEVEALEVSGPSGAEYQLEVQAMWDDPRSKGGNLRVIASIDDGRGWRAFSPLTDSFIMTPDGSFVGE